MFKLILLIAFIPFFSFAEITQSQREKIQNINEYFNSIKYFSAGFIQTNLSNSSMAEGKFYLLRPGKLRLDYTHPFDASLYSQNNVTTYYDKELDEINNIPTKSTPIHFLTRDNLNLFSEDLSIIAMEEKKGIIKLDIAEKKKEEKGTLSLYFKSSPLSLEGISIINELGENIAVKFFNPSNKKLSKSLFKFENPRLYK